MSVGGAVMNSQTLYTGNARGYPLKQQGWQLQPGRLLTMKELLEVSALEYVNVGVAIQEIRANLAAHLAPDEPLDDAAFASVTASLHRIAGCCRELGLGVSVKIVDRFLRTYKEAVPSYLQIRQEIWAFKLAFDAELEDRRFFYVPPERAGYYSFWDLFGDNLGFKIEPRHQGDSSDGGRACHWQMDIS